LGKRAEQSQDQRSIQSCCRALSLTSPKAITQASSACSKKPLEIAGNLTCRPRANARGQTLNLRILPGQQDALQLAGSLQILIHALFAFGDFAVQASVFHGTGDLLGSKDRVR